MTKLNGKYVIFTLEDKIDINLLICKLEKFEKIVPIDHIEDLSINDIYKIISESIK